MCRYLATEVRKLRIAAKESQQEFAARAGIPLRTYKRFETHGRGHLETFIRALKTAGRVEYLFMIFPAPNLRATQRASIEEKLQELKKRPPP